MKRIDSLNDKSGLDAIKNDITYAYTEGDISEVNYTIIF
jgi:hypothetical protein